MTLRLNSQAAHRAVVLVDSEQLLQLWQNEPFGAEIELAYGNIKTWVRDKKFNLTERGFSQGIHNPVPLAKVICDQEVRAEEIREGILFFRQYRETVENLVPYVSFINGITHTIWLLVNGAKFIPIEVELKSATLLQSSAGYNNSTVMLVSDIFRSIQEVDEKYTVQ